MLEDKYRIYPESMFPRLVRLLSDRSEEGLCRPVHRHITMAHEWIMVFNAAEAVLAELSPHQLEKARQATPGSPDDPIPQPFRSVVDACLAALDDPNGQDGMFA